jgi:hypothetical protein
MMLGMRVQVVPGRKFFRWSTEKTTTNEKSTREKICARAELRQMENYNDVAQRK